MILTTQPLSGMSTDFNRNRRLRLEMVANSRDESMSNILPGVLLINMYNLALYVVVAVKRYEPKHMTRHKVKSNIWKFALWGGDNVINLSSTLEQTIDDHGWRVVSCKVTT